MDIITNWLYWLTTGLLVPVVVFLLIFFVRSLLLIGSFYGTYMTRSRIHEKIKQQIENRPILVFLEDFQVSDFPNSPLAEYISKMKEKNNSVAFQEKLIGDYEVYADSELGKSKSLTKLGPMLGLMGTLIPMGPALVGLASGDITTMAHNMQVAFATTVIGVFIGAIGFITLQIKQRWYTDDLNVLEYILNSGVESRKNNFHSFKLKEYEKETLAQ